MKEDLYLETNKKEPSCNTCVENEELCDYIMDEGLYPDCVKNNEKYAKLKNIKN